MLLHSACQFVLAFVSFAVSEICTFCAMVHLSCQPGLELISKLRFTYSNVYTKRGCHGVCVTELQLPGQVRKHGIILSHFVSGDDVIDMLPVGLIRFA